MPDEKIPDFSFLHDTPKGNDSSVLEHHASGSFVENPTSPIAESRDTPDQNVPEGKTEDTSPAESQPAWMDHVATTGGPQDSSTRFAAVFGHSADTTPKSTTAESPSGGLTEAVPSSSETDDTGKEEQCPPSLEQSEESGELETSDNEETLLTPEANAAASAPGDLEETVPMTTATESEAAEAGTSATPKAESDATETSESDLNRADADQAVESQGKDVGVVAASVAAESVASAVVATSSAKQAEQSSGEKTPSSPGAARGSSKDAKSSNLLVMVLISYASAMTLFCLYLLMQSYSGKPHELESLPDLKPPMKNDEIAYRLVPEGANLPPGHTLKLGESRRFGNVVVTPLRVEKEPLKFSHYSGDPGRSRPAAGPVLKLWLKFENVSSDQKFAPIDRLLVLKRIVDASRPEFLRSNQCIAPASRKGDLTETMLLYDLEMHGDWNFAGLADNPLIGPGESVEVYLPSEELDSISLDQPLIWRVQFRKGYHPTSYRGVTTLIEVKIEAGSIQA
ncbi:MAG: hypothetical protein KDA76_11320 [Planctomycetaceae bacterium]|nr:hypothetical protein [Planctomycetaceae bacterium]